MSFDLLFDQIQSDAFVFIVLLCFHTSFIMNLSHYILYIYIYMYVSAAT